MSKYLVHPDGSDTTGSGSATNPWKTIGKAAASVPGGSTIYVAPGLYDERPSIECSGSASAPTRIKAVDRVIVSRGFVVPASYVHLIGFEVTPGDAALGQYGGQVHVSGQHNVLEGLRVYDALSGSGVVFPVGADYNVLRNFDIRNVPWSGVATSNTYNAGAADCRIAHGTIAHHGGWDAIELTGDRHLVDHVTIIGGPSGRASGSLDGDGIRVNHSHGSIIRGCTIRDLWEWYNDGQHTDCIQLWTEVYDLLIDRCTLGTWQPGPPPEQRGGLAQEIGPSQVIMCGTVTANSHVDFTLQNSLILGECGTGACIVTAKNTGAYIGVRLIGNTFWSSEPNLNSCDSLYMRNNIFRQFYLYPANLAGVDSDYNAFCWLPSKGQNAPPAGEGVHSLGRTYATRVDPATLFVNADVTVATSYGKTADFRPRAGSAAVSAGVTLCRRCRRYETCAPYIATLENACREIERTERAAARRFGAHELELDCRQYDGRTWRASV